MTRYRHTAARSNRRYPMHVVEPTSFEHWRALAREFLIEKIPPAEILWQDLGTQLSLFENSPSGNKPPRISHENPVYSVPKEFLELAGQIACHRSKERWALLYRLLWRIIHEQKLLLKNPVDDDVQLAYQMQKSVSRDCHKMKAFVRFRRVTRSATDSHQREGSDEQACEQHFV